MDEMSVDIALRIKKVGLPVKGSGKTKDPVASVCCSECGDKIRSDDIAGVGWVRTRRGTELFFHEECRRKAGTR